MEIVFHVIDDICLDICGATCSPHSDDDKRSASPILGHAPETVSETA